MSAVAIGMEDAEDPDADDADSPEELVWDDDDDDESLEIALPPPTAPGRRRSSSAGTPRSPRPSPSCARTTPSSSPTWSRSPAAATAEVNGELNRLAGVSKVTEATADQLQRRLVAGERWVRTL